MLKEIQQVFADDFSSNSSEFLKYIGGGGCEEMSSCSPAPKFIGLDAIQGLEIYRESIIAGLARSLTEIYPVCVKLIGLESFSLLAYRYSENYPSSSPSLINYGQKFSAFLNSIPQMGVALPYFPDVAALELLVHNAYYASSGSDIDLFRFNQLTPSKQSKVVFDLTPSFGLVSSEFPIKHIWEVSQDGADDEIVSLDEGADFLAVHRFGNEVRIESLSAELYLFLGEMCKGLTLSEALSSVLNEFNEFDFQASIQLALDKGFIYGFHVQN